MKGAYLLNISNHKSENWSTEQKKDFAFIVDLNFPQVDPELETSQVEEIVEKLAQEVEKIIADNDAMGYTPLIFIAGEYTFSFLMFSKLKDKYFIAVPTTQRVTVETPQPDGSTKKESVFKFVRWRFI